MIRTGTGRRLFAFVLCLVALAPPILSAGEAEDSARRAAELRRVQARIHALQQALARARAERERTRNGLRDIERRIGRIDRRLRQLRKMIARSQRRLASLRQRQRRLRRELAVQREVLGGQIRASYAMGRQEQLKILLNQGDPARIQRILVYYDYLIRDRSRRITLIDRKLDELRRVTAQIQQQRRALDGLYRRQRDERHALQAGRRQRRAMLRRLARDIRSKGQRLRTLRRAERELQRVLQAIRQTLDDIPSGDGQHRPFASLRGLLPWPVNGRVVVRFGTRRRIGNLKWRGIVIRTPRGREVRAISHGRVAFADWLRGYGNLLIIDHGNGYMSLYGHNQSLLKEVGEWVDAGDVIASAGDSGGQRYSGLYFEIRHQGKPVDPKRWLRRSTGRVVRR